MRQRDKVQAARRLHQRQQQKVYPATLGVRTSLAGTPLQVAFDYCYVNPVNVVTGVSADGTPIVQAQMELFQEGQSYSPSVDDTLTVDGVTYRLNNVRTRLNADAGYAVHDCTGTVIA